MTQDASSLLVLPDYLDGERTDRLLQALSTLWVATFGRDPGDLAEDLDLCRRWFDPVAQGQRLRRELADLPPLSATVDPPSEPLAMPAGSGRWLITPEGRCCLDLLTRLRRGGPPPYVVRDFDLLPYDRILGQLYRSWSRHRLAAVVALLEGTTKPLQIPAAGVVVALLVNRCTAEERALTRFSGGPQRDLVDAAFFAPVQAFADVLAPRRRGNRGDPRLVSGWMLYEARRRLGESLVVIDARGGIDGRVWIRDRGNVIDTVARDLVRGHRARATEDRLAEAFDALVAAFRRELPRLASFGLSHERPVETARLRDELLASLRHQRVE